MKNIDIIVNHPLYQEHLKMIESWEKDRIFCGHDLSHFLDVSRIGYIYILEKGLDVSKEVIYAYGFLHDLGRGLQYSKGIPHEEAGLTLAEEILKMTSFSDGDRERIFSAIGGHRQEQNTGQETFESLMYKADKASRACYNCKAVHDCYWSDEKKNMKIEV